MWPLEFKHFFSSSPTLAKFDTIPKKDVLNITVDVVPVKSRQMSIKIAQKEFH